MVDHEALVERVSKLIADHPRRVVAAFLIVTLVMATGMGNITTETGTSQFSEGTDSEQALKDVEREFGQPFAADSGSTQVIQTEQNVLSKSAMLRMLRAQERVTDRPSLRVTATRSSAQQVARNIDPTATTLEAQIRTIERATPKEIDAAVKRAAGAPGFTGSLSRDFNRESASASATITVITHEIPTGLSGGVGTSGTSPLQSIQTETERVMNSGTADFQVFGTGIISEEFANVIFDSLIIVLPAAILLIVIFLMYAYRDPLDLFLGISSLMMAVIWTMGFMGLANIPFTQMLTAVPPLLLAVGIDFGIHSINRYREERVQGTDIIQSMGKTVDQLLVAFFIVTGTTVIGFSANGTSSLPPIRDFGLIAAVGILFTFFIFGIFLPAAKVLFDQYREKYAIPHWGSNPIGQEGSIIGQSLSGGVLVAKKAPRIFLVVILIVSVLAAGYGAGVSTSFSQDDFLPPEDTPDYLDDLPEPFAPNEYTVTSTLNFLEDTFATDAQSSITMYVTGQLRADYALQSIQRAGTDPPGSFVEEDRIAQSSSVIGVIETYREEDPEFDALVARNDVNDDGIPDDNLEAIYDRLFESPYAGQASTYLTDDYRSAKIVYDIDSEATQSEAAADAKVLADRYRLPATATGQTVVFQDVSDIIFDSAATSLLFALIGSAIFLVFIYRLLEGSGTLGIVNLIPIVVTLTLIMGTMRAINIPFNALTATVLAIAIGLGTDYSAHMTHRFVDEYDGSNIDAALEETVLGTGGALTGSMLTTAAGVGVLVFAITPILGQFGTIMAIAIFYSYLTAVLVTPSAVVVWSRLGGFALP
ncbi:efflux RND transporter permease subunit [Halodesulfurarchaeum sp.]|uniref:efflux RND transporter permease subunit n=1 Tax=Halodesulfurarchaeum sp. TaxID=1980530 RepID=UPI002FC279AF